jgi:hypothetical protein
MEAHKKEAEDLVQWSKQAKDKIQTAEIEQVHLNEKKHEYLECYWLFYCSSSFTNIYLYLQLGINYSVSCSTQKSKNSNYN